MGQQYLIDSNTVIDYLANKLPAQGMQFVGEVVNDIPKLSVITEIEVLGYNAPEDSYRLLTEFMDAAVILNLTDEIVLQTIDLRKAHKIKIPDAIIAVTAIVFGLTLLSGNTADFRNIPRLKIINPREM